MLAVCKYPYLFEAWKGYQPYSSPYAGLFEPTLQNGPPQPQNQGSDTRVSCWIAVSVSAPSTDLVQSKIATKLVGALSGRASVANLSKVSAGDSAKAGTKRKGLEEIPLQHAWLGVKQKSAKRPKPSESSSPNLPEVPSQSRDEDPSHEKGTAMPPPKF